MCHVAVFLIDEVNEKTHGVHFKYWYIIYYIY